MNIRFDKVIRSTGFGSRKVYSLIVGDEVLVLIRTGSVGALKLYRLDEATRRVIAEVPAARSVAEIESNEAKIDSTPLDQLIGGDNYSVRLAAIEDAIVRSGQPPAMIVKVTGSDHRFTFPFASTDEVQTLRNALLRQTPA